MHLKSVKMEEGNDYQLIFLLSLHMSTGHERQQNVMCIDVKKYFHINERKVKDKNNQDTLSCITLSIA